MVLDTGVAGQQVNRTELRGDLIGEVMVLCVITDVGVKGRCSQPTCLSSSTRRWAAGWSAR
jgi:hypothetical protein